MGWENGTDDLVGKPIEDIKTSDELIGNPKTAKDLIGDTPAAARDILGLSGGGGSLSMADIIGTTGDRRSKKTSARKKTKKRNSNRPYVQRSRKPTYLYL